MQELLLIVFVGIPIGFVLGVNLCVYLENKKTRDEMPKVNDLTSAVQAEHTKESK